ncbi:hypothetical protein oki169_32730 [Helicobacter pylori]
MALSYELCCKLFDKNFENLNYTKEELFFIRECYSECSKVMDMLGEDTIEKLLKEKETIILPNVTKYAKVSINEYFENKKMKCLKN